MIMHTSGFIIQSFLNQNIMIWLILIGGLKHTRGYHKQILLKWEY